MDKQIDEKLESLLKYVPFIDYIVKMDSGKYIKFIDIKNWIIIKKRYPLSDLNKIEQSIITQYKNIMLIEDKKIPQEIVHIFKDNFKHQYVNLCSDDEDSATIGTKVDEDKLREYLTKSVQGGRSSKYTADVRSDSEDDVEIVSISLPQKSTNAESDNQITPKREETPEKSSGNSSLPVLDALDHASAKLLKEIDKIACEENENHNNEYVQPHNYHLVLSDEEEILFQRRPRRDDCKPLEENKKVKKPKRRCSNLLSAAMIDTISLDSSDDDETTIQNNCKNITKTQANDIMVNANNVESSPKREQTNRKNEKISGCAVLKTDSAIEQSCSIPNDYQTENLSNDEMCRLIESEVKNLDAHQLQTLLKQIVRKGSSTEAPTAFIENDLPSSSESGNSKHNETSLRGSPPPPAPRIETVDSSDLLDALYRFLEKAQKIERGAAVSVNTVEAPRNSENYENQQNILPFTQTSHHYQHHHPSQQQHLNFYNNPAMQASMYHQANAIPQPMYPHAFAPFNQQARAPYNTGVSKTFASAQASLKSRDPRARSALYQNSLKIIKAEVAKRNSAMQIDDVHQSLVPPVLLLNSSSAVVIQPRAMSSPILALQQQCYRMPTGVTQSNVQSYQQLHGTQNNIKNSVQPSESAGVKTKKTTLTYGEYKRRKSEEQHKLEKQREEEKRRQEAMLTRIDSISYEEYENKQRQLEDQRKAEALREEKKNQEDKREKEEQHKLEKQREEEKRRQEAMLTRIDGISHEEHENNPRQVEDQRKAEELLEEKKNQDKREKEQQHKLDKQREDEERRQNAMLTRIDGISYEEYDNNPHQVEDQCKAEELLEEKKKQAEALKRKEAEELEIKEAQKNRMDLHSILFTALQPYEDKIEKVWNTKKDPVSTEDKLGHNTDKIYPVTEYDNDNDGVQERKLNSGEKENAKDICTGKKRKNDVLSDSEKDISNAKSKKLHTEEDNSVSTNNNIQKKKSDISKSDEQKYRINNRIHRLFKEIECTFKGYDQLRKTEGKRRSNLHARTVISEQLNNSQDSEIQDDNEPLTLTEGDKRRSSLHGKQLNVTTGSSTQNDSRQSTTGGKRRSRIHSHLAEETSDVQYFTPPVRRSNIHARSAIAKQLNSQSMDSSDNYIISTDNNSCSSASSVHSTDSTKVKDIDAINHLADATNCPLPSNSEKNDFERLRVTKAQKLRETILKRQPSVVLRRLKECEIKKHCKTQEKSKSNNVLNVHLIEAGVRPDTTNDISKTSATTSKKLPLNKCNNDCEMTERNTKFCALCSTRPSDLTNHYKRKHKCESYVSRLTWSELDELCINTPFAKQVPSTNSRLDRYTVSCPFCDAKLVEPFMNLYNHYASHTGEYAFQCAACQLEKPFKADIQSHQLHSKTCRSSQIQTMYRYPPNTMSIYLHYCNICNFVQLNEANIFKHLRDHHDPRKSIPKNVQKCILAAISDGPESNSNETQPTTSQTTSSDDTQGVEMNKPVPETETPVMAKSEIDLNLDDNIPVFNEAFSEEPFDLEERLKQMQEQPCEKLTHQEPMAVLHGQSSGVGRLLIKAPSRHVPKVCKSEAMDLGEKFLLIPPRPSTVSSKSYTKNISSYSKYRPYPPNVNYLGFYKCITGDCFYSSDSAEEFVKHLEDHKRENLPEKNLLCPYCTSIISAGSCQSVLKLVDHIRTQHSHLLYQCSICCYRSCEASNVLIHQRENHSSNFQDCKIYKCPGTELSLDESYIRENMTESVGKIECSYCSNLFYSTILLMQHISTDHKTNIQERIKRYSCIYCFFWDKDQSGISKHVALNHPGEFPFLCDHNSSTGTEDLLQNLEYTSLAQSVPVIDAPATYDTVQKEISAQNSSADDIKPSVEELLRCQTEIVKIRLRKLTEKTGVAPDCLYRCPELSCGGFFSIYDLWLRHMRVKHRCLENMCPHCPIETTKSLEDFKFHLEDHRRHTYICFHCPQTFANSQHAQDHWLREHGELGLMRLEEIRYNINYAYYILIQSNDFQNGPELLASLCDVFDRRIKDLDCIEATKLKTKWLVPTTSMTLWLEQYPKHVLTPKLVKKCFNGNCNFRTKSDEILFSHVRSNHVISGSIFKCSKCDFRLENSLCWDEALNHIKQHSETSFFICGACSNYHLCRSKISEHIRSEHAARDVPIVNLLRRGQFLYATIGIVFGNERLTFSTMRNCFCCEERNMKADAFILHLKRYHRFGINYFCEWCNLPIDSLQSVKTHFRQNHTTNKLKLRCELASKANLSILSVNELQIQISANFGDQADDRRSPIAVKEDPDADDSVIIVEDDDIQVENFVKTQQTIEEKAEKPKLKCIATDSLLGPSTRDSAASQNVAQLRILPRVKIVQKKMSPSDSPPIYYTMPCADNTTPMSPIAAEHLRAPISSNSNTIGSDSNIQPINITDSIISSQRITLPSYISIQPNTNTHIHSNMMAANQCRPVVSAGSPTVPLSLPTSKRPSINKSAHIQPVQRTSAPNLVVTSLNSAVSGPQCTYTNSLPQSYNRTFQNNLQFAQDPMTSFLNSNHVPTPATTDVGMTNAQLQHIMTFPTDANTFSAVNSSMSLVNVPHVTMANTYNFQNISHPSNITQSSEWPIVRTVTLEDYAPSPHPQIQNFHYAVTQSAVENAAPSSSGHTKHPNYSIQTSYEKY